MVNTLSSCPAPKSHCLQHLCIYSWKVSCKDREELGPGLEAFHVQILLNDSKSHEAVHSQKAPIEPHMEPARWQHCSASHFLHIKKLLQGPAFCGSEHVLLETALYDVTKVQFNKNKTLSFQCAHTTQIRGDQAPPSLFRWMLESSTKHWLLGTPASTWQLQHQPPPPEVKSFSCQKKIHIWGEKKN